MTENPTADRAVEFLTRENGLAETCSREDDVAVVLRVVRDDMVMAWQAGEVYTLLDVETWMNERIRSLGVDTITGDTTLTPAEYRRNPDDH